MPQGKGESAHSPRRIDAAVKQAEALAMCRAGGTYEMIARELDYADPSGAWRAVHAALKAIVAPEVQEFRILQMDRLRSLLLGLWDKKADPKNTLAILRIMERMDKLMGTEAAIKVAIEDAPENRVLTPDEARQVQEKILEGHGLQLLTYTNPEASPPTNGTAQ